MSRRRCSVVSTVAVAFMLGACGGQPVSSSPASSAPSQSLLAPASAAAAELTYVAFGDSWPYGGHCGGCTPFPVLVHEGLESTTGEPVAFDNQVTNGGTAAQLAAAMIVNTRIRDAIASADVIVISIGGNDLGPGFDAWLAGSCGGDDKFDCFREVRDVLRGAYDTMLTEIAELRADKPTAVRMVTTSNEYLADPQFGEAFGEDFGATAGVAITAMNRDAQCEVAEAHGAICVDLGAALNGPDLLAPVDVNTQEAMQQVADLILAAGLPELGR